MSTLILPTPTRDEQDAEDFDPVPCIALARGGVTLVPFQLALPWGNGDFFTRFVITDHLGVITQGAVRYSQFLPPTYLPCQPFGPVGPADEVVVVLVSR
jgi:hypothetical protein